MFIAASIAWVGLWFAFVALALRSYRLEWTALLNLNLALLFFLALPVCFLVPVLLVDVPPLPAEHRFFKEWVSIYVGASKASHVPFFAEWMNASA